MTSAVRVAGMTARSAAGPAGPDAVVPLVGMVVVATVVERAGLVLGMRVVAGGKAAGGSGRLLAGRLVMGAVQGLGSG